MLLQMGIPTVLTPVMTRTSHPSIMLFKKRSDTFLDWSSHDRTAELLAGMLLRAGADPNARTKQGGTPLCYVDTTCPGLIDLLVRYGADVNARALSGRTPLLRLILRGNSWDTKLDTKLFQALISNGADINAADGKGDTIFRKSLRHWTASNRRTFRSSRL